MTLNGVTGSGGYGQSTRNNAAGCPDQRILDAANSNQKQCFEYDALDRLTQATTNGNADLGCTGDLGNGNYHQDYSYRDFDGNLFSRSGVGAYNYNDGNHKHAITSTGNGWIFTYDANGNMTQRNTGTVLDMSYDAENRLVQVNKNGALHMTNIYDGDGQRVKTIIEGTPNDTVLTYLGNYYEVETIGSASTTRSYYYAGSQRLAMRLNADLYYLVGDHLGSTSLSYKADGSDTKTQLYRAWGENRHPTDSTLPTTMRYTGQRAETSLGIYFYNARWYDQWTGRFLQADTVVPGAGNPGAWDKYAYSYGNPVKYIDTDGHWPCSFSSSGFSCSVSSFGLGGTVSRVGEKLGVKNASNIVSGAMSTFGLGLDIAAEAVDIVASAIVTTGIAIGATGGAAITLPGGGTAVVTGALGASVGWATAEIGVKPLIFVGNALASLATLSTVSSELLSGDTGLETTWGISSGGIELNGRVEIGSASQVSSWATTAGWLSPLTYPSLGIQTVAILGDIGVVSPPPIRIGLAASLPNKPKAEFRLKFEDVDVR